MPTRPTNAEVVAPYRRAYVGGSFAPPLPAEKLAEYRTIIADHGPDDIRDTLQDLCDLVAMFTGTPESSQATTPHPCGVGHVQKLDDAEIARLWDACPWPWEVDALRLRCASIPADSPLRTPAYHLLWYAKELAEDREPCTADKISC